MGAIDELVIISALAGSDDGCWVDWEADAMPPQPADEVAEWERRQAEKAQRAQANAPARPNHTGPQSASPENGRAGDAIARALHSGG